jgi:uncharacterized protein (TIGR02453 family)
MRFCGIEPSMKNFSPKTIAFLKKALKQKRPDWLEKNHEEYEAVIREPLVHLAETVSRELRKLAPDYHFPQKGIGRLKRPAHRVEEKGGGLYKGWLSYSAGRPRASRFEHNPNLYFMIDSEDDDDPVLVAGGLYMPSSNQLRKIREFISNDASIFDRLFESKDFARRFRGGFSKDKTATRAPRGFDPDHERMDWLKLQAFFVWRPYTKKEFSSPKFASLVAADFKQILRMNRLLESVLSANGSTVSSSPGRRPGLLDRLEGIQAPIREMDF